MPVGIPENGHGYHQLIRRVRVVRGEVRLRMECSPAFDYARARHETKISDRGATFRAPGLCLGLSSHVPLRESAGSAVAEFSLHEGETVVFVLQETEAGGDCGPPPSEKREEELFRRTVGYWRRWLSRCTYTGRWREVVHRSALALKLLTFEPTGAMVAAPTMGLPEGVGGERNWDYRYTWIRDAAFTLYGLLRIGFTEEAEAFMG